MIQATRISSHFCWTLPFSSLYNNHIHIISCSNLFEASSQPASQQETAQKREELCMRLEARFVLSDQAHHNDVVFVAWFIFILFKKTTDRWLTILLVDTFQSCKAVLCFERQKALALRQELKTRHLNNMEMRAKSVRDVQGARQALQSRQPMLTKLQGEVGNCSCGQRLE